MRVRRMVIAALVGAMLQVATLVGLAAAADLAQIRKRLEAHEPTTIVCLGDSVTGVYYHTGGRRAYTDMVGLAIKTEFPEAKLTMVNAGISGHTTRNGLDRFDKDVLAKRPQLVTIMFGLNDMTRIPLADFQKNLREMIARARAIDAQVLLCTPNGVIDSSGRPVTRLIEYCDAIRAVGRDENVPVADCYAAYEELKARDARAWRLLLSDAIHPNMDGHKLLATTMTRAILEKTVSLERVGPPAEPLRHTRAKLAAGQKLKIVAMTPYDERLKTALAKVAPQANVEWVAWPAAGQSLAQIAEFGKQVRGLKPDLVWVAVPGAATMQAGDPSHDQAIGGYSAVLNAALSFGWQEWDVVGATPALWQPGADDAVRAPLDFCRRMILAQDLTLVDRADGDTMAPEELLETWLRRELGFESVKQPK